MIAYYLSFFKTDLLQIINVDADQDKVTKLVTKLDKKVTYTHMLIFGKRITCLTTCYLKGIN